MVCSWWLGGTVAEGWYRSGLMADRELPRFDEDTPRLVPSIATQDGATLVRLVGVMRRLLGPGGCPWDREQTYESLRKYVLEEACEVIDAIDGGDRDALREELGDLLLQVVFQSELARRVTMKFTPHLIFHLDESIARGSRIVEILQQIDADSEKPE